MLRKLKETEARLAVSYAAVLLLSCSRQALNKLEAEVRQQKEAEACVANGYRVGDLL